MAASGHSLSSLHYVINYAAMRLSAECPSGYKVMHDGWTTIVIRRDYEHLLLRQGIASPEKLFEARSRGSGMTHSGRGTTPSIPIEGSSQERMVIRKYRRGGLLRFLIDDIYVGGTRPFQELAMGTAAYRRGIPTSEILAAVSVRIGGPFYRGYLITKELSGCQDLPRYFTTVMQGSLKSGLENKRKVLAHVAATIRCMHDAGFYHGDLNLKNVLIDGQSPDRIYIIDWDKSRAGKPPSLSQRRKNVLRFCRSMEKLRLQGLPVTERDQLFFLRAYWGRKDKGLMKRLRKDFIRMKFSLSARKLRWKIENIFDRKQKI
jgi:3-deoxy-D-manno-octulosonic acid kinase